LRDRQTEYERRGVQPLIVMAQQPFQLKRPKDFAQGYRWPREVPAEVLFDPVSTVSATYGVAFQTQFRGGQGPWSSQPALFVIDRDGVLRYADSRPNNDYSEKEVFPILGDLDELRLLITALQTREAWREASRIALAAPGPRSKTAVGVLTRALKDESAQTRAGAAAALYWIAPQAGAAVPALSAALADSDSRVRRLCCLALGGIGPPAREEARAIAKLLADPDTTVRTAARQALQRIGTTVGPKGK
jgi:HEAT repeat protein